MSDALFTPIRVGDLDLPNRVVMAPMTRSRSKQPGDVPRELNAEYYEQRASAGVIVTEATWVEPRGKGYAFIPGVETDEQVEGWKLITEAVHEAGGRILLQLWHSGRVSHEALQPGEGRPIAPSAVRAETKTYIDAESGMVDVSEPRALETSEIPGVIDAFRAGAENAKRAGFDGVELHGANGYLLDQFLRSGSNSREDEYGGSVESRARFPLEVAQAVSEVWGAGLVGYRVSPLSGFNDMSDDAPSETFGYLASELGALGLAYIHVVEDSGDGTGRGPLAEPVLATIRERFKEAGGGAYIGNHGYTPEEARERIETGRADLVAFGQLYIANPDLTTRIQRGGPYAEADQDTFYGGDEKGYTDYPTLAAEGSV